MIRALQYALDEAVASLWRGRQSGLLSTATIALAVFVLGAFLVVTSNLERLGDEWSRAGEMSVYLKDDVTPEERLAIEAALAPGSTIALRQYVSKAEALARFKQTFGDLAVAVEGLGDNPLPASYEVRLQGGAAIEALGAQLRRTPGVSDVRYDRQWLARLMAVVETVQGVGVILGTLLTIAAALTVANVVRLALYARRDELEIMQLVGAPQIYIRGPFVMEGVLQGGAGSLIALTGLAVTFFVLRGRYLMPLATAINLSAVHFLPATICALLVFGGMVVGCLGGLVAAMAERT